VADYQLYCFAQSGNAYKVALMLELAGADWEPVFVDFFNGETRTPAFRAINGMGEVPVLVHGETTLSQSGAILDYLTETLGRLAPETPEDRRKVLRWTLWDNHKLTGTIATLRFMRAFLPEEKRDPGAIRFLDGRARAALAMLDSHMAAREWVTTGALTTADLSCAGYLFYDGEFGIDLADYPHVLRWRERLRALPRWRHPYELMPGHPLPARGDAP
jgi:glutathione S-transferase